MQHLAAFFKDKRVLITGHTGFKGAWLSLWLNKLKSKVYGLSRSVPTEPSLFKILKLEETVESYWTDIRDLEAVQEVINKVKPDVVFHTAAQALTNVALENPVETFSTNIMGTVNMLESVRGYDRPCAVVLVTSDKCYENKEWKWGYRENDRIGGKDPYSASKGGSEIVIHSYYHSYFKNEHNVRVASVRAGNIIGGGDWSAQRLIPDCVKAWMNNQPVIIRSPDSVRPWQHIFEPLYGYLLVAKELIANPALNGEAYNFGPNPQEVKKVVEVVDAFSKHSNIDVSKPYEIRQTLNSKEHTFLKLSYDMALHDLNWSPVVNFQKGVQLTADWYDNYYNKTGNGKMGEVEFSLKQLAEYESLRATHN